MRNLTKDKIAKLMNSTEKVIIKSITTLKNKYEMCVAVKQAKKPFKNVERNIKIHLELIHSDIIRLIEPCTPEGHRYMISFTDNYT